MQCWRVRMTPAESTLRQINNLRYVCLSTLSEEHWCARNPASSYFGLIYFWDPLYVNPSCANCAFTLHWVCFGAAEMTCADVRRATGDRCSASHSLVLPLQPEGRPGPTVPPGSAPAWLLAGTPAAAYHTTDRLWSADRGRPRGEKVSQGAKKYYRRGGRTWWKQDAVSLYYLAFWILGLQNKTFQLLCLDQIKGYYDQTGEMEPSHGHSLLTPWTRCLCLIHQFPHICWPLIGDRNTAEDESVAVVLGSRARLADAFQQLPHSSKVLLSDKSMASPHVDSLGLQLEILRGWKYFWLMH